MPNIDSVIMDTKRPLMRTRALVAIGMLTLLGGCATYDYTGGSRGGYYRGTPSVQYRYPPGYYGGYYDAPYYGPGWNGLYEYPVYPGGNYYRPIYRPPPRHGLRPPPTGGYGPRPPRPSQPPRPAQPRPAQPRPSVPSPSRDLNRIRSGRSAQRNQEP